MHSDSKLIENQTCDESKVLMAVPVRTDCGLHGVDGTNCGPHGVDGTVDLTVLMARPVHTDCGPHGVDGTDCGPHGGSSSAHRALSPLLHDTEPVSAAGTLGPD